MGRTQVARNRIHGRPGKGGRGNDSSRIEGRGRGNQKREGVGGENKKQELNDLGSNAFRYEKQSRSEATTFENETSDSMFDYVSGGNEFGASHYSVAQDVYQRGEKDEDEVDLLNHETSLSLYDTIHNTFKIDVKSLSLCLEQDVDLHYLRFDDKRMTETFRKRFYMNGEEETTMTVGEQRILGHQLNTMDLSNEGNKCKEKEHEVTKEENSPNSNEDVEVEDLEDWLDDMIGT